MKPTLKKDYLEYRVEDINGCRRLIWKHPLKMKTDSDTLAEKNREHLRKAIADGGYFTERDSMFYE